MAYIISEESDSNYGTSLATISSANVMVVLPISISAISGYIYLASNGSLTSKINQLMVLITILACLALISIYLTWFRSDLGRRIVAKVLKIFHYIPSINRQKIHNSIESFLDHAENSCANIGENPLFLVKPSIMVFLAYFFTLTSFYLVAKSLGINLSFFHVMILLPIASVANFSPTPGGTGVVEASLTGLSILLLGIDISLAFAAAILFRVTNYWLKVSIGYFALISLDIENIKHYENKIEL